MVVLLDTQVAVSVMSCPPLHEAVKEAEGALGERAPVLGVIVIALVQAIETVSGWVPVMARRGRIVCCGPRGPRRRRAASRNFGDSRGSDTPGDWGGAGAAIIEGADRK